MAQSPLYLTPANVTQAAILARLLNALTLGFDTAPGSIESDILNAFAIELAQAAILPQDFSNRAFTATSYAPYLDYRAQERGLSRLGAIAATGTVTFTAQPGQSPTVPSGTRVGTTSSPSVVFTTNSSVTLPTGGTASVAVTAQVAGAAGNVGSGTVTFMVDTVTGILSVANASAMTGGADQESDAALRARTLLKASQPPTTGNQYNYQQAALAVAGVGAAQAVRAWGWPGNVGLFLADSSNNPVSAAVVTAVENAIINPWRLPQLADGMTIGGFGGAIDNTMSGGDGHAVAFSHSASGAGTLTQTGLANILTQPGVWRAKVNLAYTTPTGTGNLATFGVQYTSNSSYVPINPPSNPVQGQAVTTLTATAGFDGLSAPTLSAAGAGGTWSAATGWVKVTAVTQDGLETLASAVTSQAVGASGTLTIKSPTMVGNFVAWYAYVGTGASEPADSAKYRQQLAGVPTPMGTDLTITANPTTSGAALSTITTTTGFTAANAYQTFEQDFYWDGQSAVQFVFTRLTTDATTKIWVDAPTYQSSMPRDDQPTSTACALGDRVIVAPATTASVNISVHVTYKPGLVATTVQSAVQASLQKYLSGIGFGPNEIVYGAVAAAILTNPSTGVATGVQDFTPASLTINGSAQNLTLSSGQVPQLGTITYT